MNPRTFEAMGVTYTMSEPVPASARPCGLCRHHFEEIRSEERLSITYGHIILTAPTHLCKANTEKTRQWHAIKGWSVDSAYGKCEKHNERGQCQKWEQREDLAYLEALAALEDKR